MKRRDLLKLAGWSAIGATLPVAFRTYAAGEGYSGPLMVCVQVSGGWDVTSFCDPKINQPGEEPINTWANTGDVQQTGNIQYAPFAGNAVFFEKYRDYMMVVNGIDEVGALSDRDELRRLHAGYYQGVANDDHHNVTRQST